MVFYCTVHVMKCCLYLFFMVLICVFLCVALVYMFLTLNSFQVSPSVLTSGKVSEINFWTPVVLGKKACECQSRAVGKCLPWEMFFFFPDQNELNQNHTPI